MHACVRLCIRISVHAHDANLVETKVAGESCRRYGRVGAMRVVETYSADGGGGGAVDGDVGCGGVRR